MRSLLITVLISLLVGIACTDQQDQTENQDDGYFFTCPMHPSVVSQTPGACPICNMTLVRRKSAPTLQPQTDLNPDIQETVLYLSNRQQELIGLLTDTVKMKSMNETATILGTVAINEDNVSAISSRVKGRIDKLYRKSSGEYVQTGSPLYSIYSEQLQAEEKEYLVLKNAKKSKKDALKYVDELLAASKNKLLLWGVSEKQIMELESNGKPDILNTFYSKQSGYVAEVLVREGQYVNEGSQLLKIVDLSSVWIEAQLYPDETTKKSTNEHYTVYSALEQDKKYTGRVVFNNPTFVAGKKIELLRLKVDNSNGKLIPGTMVYVIPHNAARPVLTVPKAAILLEKMPTVWVKSNDTTFTRRMIAIGKVNNRLIEVVSGLHAGEVVVTTGSYLINSENILKSGASQKHNH